MKCPESKLSSLYKSLLFFLLICFTMAQACPGTTEHPGTTLVSHPASSATTSGQALSKEQISLIKLAREELFQRQSGATSNRAIRGRLKNLLWVHNMPSRIFLSIIENSEKFFLKPGARGNQFRFGLEPQYGDISFILKTRSLPFWQSKKGRNLRGVSTDNAVFYDLYSASPIHLTPKQIKYLELPQQMRREALDFGYRPVGLSEEIKRKFRDVIGCYEKLEQRPVWCNLQMHLDGIVNVDLISAIILPKFLKVKEARIKEMLPGVELLYNDTPAEYYYDYYKMGDYFDKIKMIAPEIKSGSIMQAIENGTMRSNRIGNSSLVSLSNEALEKSLLLYIEHVITHTSFANERFIWQEELPFSKQEILDLNSYYTRPYTGRTDTPDSLVHLGVPRANHGLAHALRQAALVYDILNFLKKYGRNDHYLSHWIRENSAQDPYLAKKLMMAAAYQRSGRVDETSPFNDIVHYAPQGLASAQNFELAATRSQIFKEGEIESYKRIIMRDEIVKFYQLSDENRPAGLKDRGGPLKNDELQMDAIVHTSHVLDLRRLKRNWNSKAWMLQEISLGLGLSSALDLDQSIVLELYKRAGQYLKATGDRDLEYEPEAGKNSIEDRYQDVKKFLRQASNPDELVEAINSVLLQPIKL